MSVFKKSKRSPLTAAATEGDKSEHDKLKEELEVHMREASALLDGLNVTKINELRECTVVNAPLFRLARVFLTLLGDETHTHTSDTQTPDTRTHNLETWLHFKKRAHPPLCFVEKLKQLTCARALEEGGICIEKIKPEIESQEFSVARVTEACETAGVLCAWVRHMYEAQTKHHQWDKLNRNAAVLIHLGRAQQVVYAMDRKDLREIRYFALPPPMTTLVGQCICVLMGQEENWTGFKRALQSEVEFIRKLQDMIRDAHALRECMTDRKYARMNVYVQQGDDKWHEAKLRNYGPGTRSLGMYVTHVMDAWRAIKEATETS